MLELFETPLTVLHIFVCFFLILVVLIQPGKSGGLGAALGGSGATQVFGGRGAGNFLSKATWVCASVFFLTSIVLAYISSSADDSLERHAAKSSAASLKTGGKQDNEPVRDEGAAAPGLGDTPAEEPAAPLDEPNAASEQSESQPAAEQPAAASAPAPLATTPSAASAGLAKPPVLPTPVPPAPVAPAPVKPAVPAAPVAPSAATPVVPVKPTVPSSAPAAPVAPQTTSTP